MSTSSSAYSFLVAVASASSSAPNTMSFGTFFSRASASTNNKISRLMNVRSPNCLHYRSSSRRHPTHSNEPAENPAPALAAPCRYPSRRLQRLRLPAHVFVRLFLRPDRADRPSPAFHLPSAQAAIALSPTPPTSCNTRPTQSLAATRCRRRRIQLDVDFFPSKAREVVRSS